MFTKVNIYSSFLCAQNLPLGISIMLFPGLSSPLHFSVQILYINNSGSLLFIPNRCYHIYMVSWLTIDRLFENGLFEHSKIYIEMASCNGEKLAWPWSFEKCVSFFLTGRRIPVRIVLNWPKLVHL